MWSARLKMLNGLSHTSRESYLMDIKTLFAIIAAIISTACFVPYLKDIFLKKTKPHIYTWLIWTLTQATGAIGILYGGGGFGGLQLVTGTLFIFMIFLLSVSYGTK